MTISSAASRRALAERLLAMSRTEGAQDAEVATAFPESRAVFEILRSTLTRFAGGDGFVALARRALVLARSDVPALDTVRIGSGGELEGFEQAISENGSVEPAVALIAHLLTLLEIFVGESLMIRIVREGWPDASWDV